MCKTKSYMSIILNKARPMSKTTNVQNTSEKMWKVNMWTEVRESVKKKKKCQCGLWKGEEMLASRVAISYCANGHQAGPFIRRVVNPKLSTQGQMVKHSPKGQKKFLFHRRNLLWYPASNTSDLYTLNLEWTLSPFTFHPSPSLF